MSAMSSEESIGAAGAVRGVLLAQAAAREGPRRPLIEQLVRSYLDSLSKGDIEARLALFAPDASFEDPVGTPAMVGHAALRAFWTAGAGIEVRARLEHLAIAGDEAAFLFTAEIAAASDDRVAIRVVETIEVDDKGLISRMRAYFDRGAMT